MIKNYPKIRDYLEKLYLDTSDDVQCFGSKILFVKLINKFKALDIRRPLARFYNRSRWVYAKKFVNPPTFISRLLPRPKKSVRRYIDPKLGLVETFKLLNSRNVEYVILRWYENLPLWPEGEDIDILVSDKDLHKLDDIFVWHSKLEPVDIYTVTSQLGWNGLSYFPPHLSLALLNDRILAHGTFFIPSQEHQFTSLAFHAIFRKGVSSGVPIETSVNSLKCDDHDYVKTLHDKAIQLNLAIPLTMLGLWEALKKHEWLPELDTVTQYTSYNPWLYSRLNQAQFHPERGEFLLFIIRDEAERSNLTSIIERWFDRHQNILTPIFKYKLSESEKKLAAQYIRGGNWGKGPFHRSGGKPYAFYGFFDYLPSSIDNDTKNSFPMLNNSHYRLKDNLRKYINRNQLFTRSCNIVHTPDNETEAFDYIKACLNTQSKQELLQKIELHKSRCYNHDLPVVKQLNTFGTRSKIELINWGTRGRAIKKTFKIGQERFLERELKAYTDFSDKTTLVPPLLDTGSGYFIIPYYEELEKTPKAIYKYKDEILFFLEFIYQQGYFLVDFNPNNILISRNDGVKFIDFEFLQKYKNTPSNFKSSFDIKGVPLDVQKQIDLPTRYSAKRLSYKKIWEPILGKEK